MLPKRVYKRDDVWTEAEYARLLRDHDIFLNIHKGCGDPHNPVTFRVTKILNAGGIIVSERAHPLDEEAYAGLVSFVNITQSNLSGIAREYLRIASLSASERAELADERQRSFRQRFSPSGIFERAGLYELFDRQLINLSASMMVGADVTPTQRGARRRRGQDGKGRVVADAHRRLSHSNRVAESSRNAVLATVDFAGFPPWMFLPFICSFVKHVPDTVLVLFVRPAAAIALFNPPHPRVKLVPWPTAYNRSKFSQIFRYNVYADYLQGPEGSALDKVAVSDAADVAFQADPFEHVGEGDELVFGNDKDIVGKSHGNRYWIRNLYGATGLERVAKRNVSTSGYTMGRHAGMSRYLRRMAAEINRLLVPRLPELHKENWMLSKGYDQGIHVWLLYEEFLRQPLSVATRVLKYDEVYISGAAGMRLGRDVTMPGGEVVRNMRNATIAVVHQWNRMNFAVRDALSCGCGITAPCKRRGGNAGEPGYCTECRRSWRIVHKLGEPKRGTPWTADAWTGVRLEYQAD